MARDRIRHPSVRAYLMAITRNLYRDHCRSYQPLTLELDAERPPDGPGLEVRIEQRSELRNIRARLRQVAAGDRRALLLYVVRELSYEQIADRLGIPIGSVKSRISRAREALRRFPKSQQESET